MTIVVAMDGPSGSGKSSTSKTIAKRAGWLYLDTGALYRAATWLAIRETIDDAQSLVEALQKYPIVFKTDPDNPITLCGGVDVSTTAITFGVTAKDY
jgi:GTP-binding protein